MSKTRRDSGRTIRSPDVEKVETKPTIGKSQAHSFHLVPLSTTIVVDGYPATEIFPPSNLSRDSTVTRDASELSLLENLGEFFSNAQSENRDQGRPSPNPKCEINNGTFHRHPRSARRPQAVILEGLHLW